MAILEKPKPVDFKYIGFELDRISWENLEERYPELASAIVTVICAGATPEQVKRYAIRRGTPRAWAAWLEQAARVIFLEET